MELAAALIGALVGGGVALLTSLWSLARTRRDNQAAAEVQHRRGRRSIMARISVWADLAQGPQLLVLNNSAESIHALSVEGTLMLGSSLDNIRITASSKVEVGFVPPTAHTTSRPLPGDWLLPKEFANGTAFCVLAATFQDALGDFWRIGEDGEVILEKSAEDFEAELLAAVESPDFGTSA
jgi:hypothetical protein